MASDTQDGTVESPRGWAIVGAFVGVLFGYVATMEATLHIATAAIVGCGLLGAVVMNEIEYQFIRVIDLGGMNLSSVLPPAAPNADTTIIGATRQSSFLSKILTRLIPSSSQKDIEMMRGSGYSNLPFKHEELPYLMPIDVSEDELIEFVSSHREQLDVYPSYFILREGASNGLIILHPALFGEDNAPEIAKTVWYSSEIYPVLFDDESTFTFEDVPSIQSEWTDLNDSDDGPSSIEDLMDWEDEGQSN